MTEIYLFYWDVALVLNLVTLLPWLWATARLAGQPVRWWRLGVTSLIGSAAAVLWVWAGWRSVTGALLGTLLLLQIAFGPLRPARLLRTFVPFVVIGASAAGLSLMGIWQTGGISPGVLIGIALMAGGVPVIWSELLARANNTAHRWRVRLTVGERSLSLDGLVDTGHQLRAPLTGMPVLLVSPKELAPLLGSEVCQRLSESMAEWDRLPAPWRGRVRLIPYRTVAGEGLLPAFRPDGIWLQRAAGPWQRVEALVGVASFGLGGRGDYQVLLPPLLMDSLSPAWEVERR